MRAHTTVLFAVIGVFLILTSPQALAEAPATVQRFDSLLESIRQKHSLPALAGAIVTSKGPTAIGAVGARKAGTAVPVTVDDQWHLGSDTKAMTATMIAALVEQGKLTWETTIEQVFPEIAATLPPQLRKVTILQLLSHRAGLPADTDWRALSLSGSLLEQRQAALKSAASIKIESEPGTTFTYSNWGYVIAGAMVEKIANAPWEELMAQHLFDPLGIKSAGFGGLGTPGKTDQPWPHGADGKPVFANGPTVDNPPVLGPAGTVHCSLSDWARFIADHLRGARGEHALLKPETYKVLHTPPFGGEYALGWIVTERDWGGGAVMTHAGSNTMNFAVVWMAPQRGLAVLVCTNQGGLVAAQACDEAASALIQLHLNM